MTHNRDDEIGVLQVAFNDMASSMGHTIEEFNMQPFIATLATQFLARGLASIISTDFGVPAEAVTIVVGLMILIFVVLQRTVSALNKQE